ncbi:hypothetical protein TRFO_29089 [Tritrichomonas foetus]|uniref:Uncharacterized protein n=1 Tax=Tritrichomonas foetus TaxID=1144522 RepID=A0A1J4JWL2_9EUKA|nr:hypothetical protein TRFO_29089 [Tritrichomonas foetus]|eukprot:OHT03535.1 hypothetical protein TRFO_29089 [Tritrichomonas foetus]
MPLKREMTPEECFLKALQPDQKAISTQKGMEAFISELAKNGHITQQDTWITSVCPQPSPLHPITFDDFRRAVIDTEFKPERLAFEDHCARIDESLDLLERQVKKALTYPSDVVDLHFILSTIQELKQTIVGSSAATDNEQDNKIQRFRNFFWSRIEGIEPPVPMPIAQRIALVGQLVKANRKKIQLPVRARYQQRRQLKPGVCTFPADDSAKNRVEVIEVDALTASYTVYHKEALDFQIAREFLPSKCFRVPLDMKCEAGDKVWFIYEGTRYIPILQFFSASSKLSEQNPLFSHWRSRIAAALCDISMYGSKRLAAPLTSKNISVSSDGDVIAIVDAEWGAEKELDAREEPLAIQSLVNIMSELINEKVQGPILKCILEIAREGGCTIYDIVRHQYFRSFQPVADVRSQMRSMRSAAGDNQITQMGEDNV